jgi:uncharacterized membrane protein YphA (DoxX/SURF4 family)
MLLKLLGYHEEGLLMLRVVVAIIFLVHGVPKLKTKGWVAVGIVECLGALSIGLGVYTQVGALVLAAIMVGAIYFKVVKWHVPFKTMTNTGWEFDLILLAACLFIATHGGSLYSLIGY